jgi:alpha-1,6-mannosyltransferase
VRRALAAACAALVLVVLPDGFAPDAERVLLAVTGAAAGLAVFSAVRVALRLSNRAAPAAMRLARGAR